MGIILLRFSKVCKINIAHEKVKSTCGIGTLCNGFSLNLDLNKKKKQNDCNNSNWWMMRTDAVVNKQHDICENRSSSMK